jgi:HAD superfamily hydrolase (TIGR01509 family)
MIKLLIFDLDGVLVETKGMHYRILNRALEESGLEPISFVDHITKYDGKPTKVKLSMLDLPGSKIEEVNRIKQKYTREEFDQLISDYRLQKVLYELKECGYKLVCASNSVRNTVEIALLRLGMLNIFDSYISNEDVEHPKPNSEMYLKCMIKYGVDPKETIIIEDSYIGRKGAWMSGAHVCDINTPNDVTFGRLMTAINKAEGKRFMWKDPNLNIVIPMAGSGKRFKAAGYTFPKPLIDVNGKSMIQVVKENLNIEGQFIFIVDADHYAQYNLGYMLSAIAPGCQVIVESGERKGAVWSVLKARKYIDNDKQLLLANSDQFIEWDSSDFMYQMQSNYVDGGIPVFKNSHPKWSYAKVEDGYVTKVAEKQVISDNATVGLYFWKHGSDFVKYADQMIKKGIKTNNEFYVCPVYNQAIEDGKRIKTYEVDKMSGLGTPEDLERFLYGRS